MASTDSAEGTEDSDLSADELAELLTDPATDVTVDEMFHSVSLEDEDRVRKEVLRVRIVENLDD